MSDTKIKLIINEFETRQQAEDNLDALNEKELIFTKDKVLPNPTQSDNGKAVIVEDGDFALGDVTIEVDQEYDPSSENPQSGIAMSEPIEGLSDSIDAINEKIPNVASSSNQLADKAFVNSTVQTATANFRGNWSTWQDVPTNDQLYPVDYLGIKTPSTNDYMTVGDASDYPDQVLSGVWRFKYSGVWATSNKSGWRPEYKVNDEPMTQAQLNALNSGITIGRVEAYDEHIGQTDNPHNVTKAQVGLGNVDNTSDLDKPISTAAQTALDGKQATLVSGTNIKTIGGVSLLGSGDLPSGGVPIRRLVPYDAVFANNTWTLIKQACQKGRIPVTWLVGDTKTFTGTDGNTYTIRLSDKQSGRYTYSSDSTKTTSAVFELVEVIPTNYQWNTTSTNAGGYADSAIQVSLNDTIINILPDEIKNLLENVQIKSSTGTYYYTGQSESANKLFLLSRAEVTDSSATAKYQDETINNGTTYGRLDYYASHDDNASRKKNAVGTTTEKGWWLRSPRVSDATSVGYVVASGGADVNNASGNARVSFAWAW